MDASALRPGMVRTKRKRKIIVDEVKAIAGEEMKAQVCMLRVRLRPITPNKGR